MIDPSTRNQKTWDKNAAFLAQDQPFQMPKACISCQHYKHLGVDDDPMCVSETQRWMHELRGDPMRTAYGRCDRHGCEVFATQLCNSYLVELFVYPKDVTNRPEPRIAIQEILL